MGGDKTICKSLAAEKYREGVIVGERISNIKTVVLGSSMVELSQSIKELIAYDAVRFRVRSQQYRHLAREGNRRGGAY
jgi:predicted HTH domain antitoxin